MLNRRIRIRFGKKKKKDDVPVTREDLLRAQREIREDSQKAQAVLGQRLETMVKLQTLTPRQRLRLIKAGIRRERRHG